MLSVFFSVVCHRPVLYRNLHVLSDPCITFIPLFFVSININSLSYILYFSIFKIIIILYSAMSNDVIGMAL